MMQVLTQTFVDSFLTGFVVYAFWWYVTCKTIDKLIRLVENHLNLLKCKRKMKQMTRAEPQPVRATQPRGVKHLD